MSELAMTELVIRSPDDFHVHLRQGEPLISYARRSASRFARILPMPNTLPPLDSAESLLGYLASVRSAAPGLEIVPSFKLVPGMGAETVRVLARAGALAGKYYPAGATTNSADGVANPARVERELAAMEELGLVLSFHAEDPLAPSLEREAAFLPVVDRVIRAHTGLRVTVEHVSTASAVEAVRSWPATVAATITAHHMAFTLDDMLGDGMDPHYYCRPLLKGERDRDAVAAAATSGDAKFFFGSDSAPHPRARKESGKAPAGVYSAPVALELLAGVFEERGALSSLEAFVSEFGARFYGLPLNPGTVTLARESWVVPGELDGSVPLAAGRTLPWKAADRR